MERGQQNTPSSESETSLICSCFPLARSLNLRSGLNYLSWNTTRSSKLKISSLVSAHEGGKVLNAATARAPAAALSLPGTVCERPGTSSQLLSAEGCSLHAKSFEAGAVSFPTSCLSFQPRGSKLPSTAHRVQTSSRGAVTQPVGWEQLGRGNFKRARPITQTSPDARNIKVLFFS